MIWSGNQIHAIESTDKENGSGQSEADDIIIKIVNKRV